MGQKKEDGKRLGGASLNLPKIRKNPLIEIIPINTGCLNHCTYCKTKHARGDLASYPPEEIVERVRSVIQEGVIEIWLTSEDTGTYGRDIGSSLPELLWAIVNILPSHVMLRLGMTNPPYILEHLAEVAKILNHPQVYAFLHIPVQAGSDKVLNLMRREYTSQDFCEVVDFLRKEVPGISIATDVICGFPGETEEDFSETIQLIEKYKFPSLFISQFYPRPGTPAARMERVPTLEVKRRSRVVTQLFESYSTYSGEEGKVFLVSVTQMTDDGRQYVSHDKFYRQVLIDRQENGPELFGKRCHVKIREAGKYYLLADLVEIIPHEAAVIINLPKKAPKKIQKSKAKDQQQPKREGNEEEEEEEEEEEKELNEDHHGHDNYDRNHHHQDQDQENQEKNDQGWCSNDCEGEGCGDGCECSPGKGKEKQKEKEEKKEEEKDVRPPFPESILYDLEQETEGEKARRERKDRVDPFPKKESMRKKNSLTKAHYGGFVVALILSVLLAGNFFTDYMPI